MGECRGTCSILIIEGELVYEKAAVTGSLFFTSYAMQQKLPTNLEANRNFTSSKGLKIKNDEVNSNSLCAAVR